MVKTLPEIIAHRGSTYLAPENTLSAFRNAIDLGADGVEMDVQQTRDHGLITTTTSSTSAPSFPPRSTT